jgi:uncharacterized protein (DUF39 family)
MIHETDLPCSDCGGSLLERDVAAGEFVDVEAAETVAVAECTDCGARHFPDGTVRRLYDDSEPSVTAGGR